MISVRNLRVDIGEKTLLEDVSFDARPGEVTGLIGPNGAGKSTLLAAISGDLEVTSGSISVCGLDPATASPIDLARARAVMLQDVSVAFEFLVRDVVAMGRRPWRGTEQEQLDDVLVDAALAATDAAHLAERDIITLSGGERARVALARVIAQHTPVMMLDEPTAALDISHQEQVLGLVRSIAKQANVAVIVVLHDLNAAAAYCDQIVCVSNGGIASLGSVEEVYTDELLSSVYNWPVRVTKLGEQISIQPARLHNTDAQTRFLSLLQH